MGTLLGSIDIYRVIGTASCDLQTVEQFPFEVIANLNSVISKLENMSKSLVIANPDHNANNEDIDHSDWPHLAKHLQELKQGRFKNLAVGGDAARRASRIRSYLDHEDDLQTVQNRLTTLCKYQAKHIKDRTLDNEDHPYNPIIPAMDGCLNLQKMIAARESNGFDLSMYGSDNLEKVLTHASYPSDEADQMKLEYKLFRARLFDLLFNETSNNKHLLDQFEHLLYKTHSCSDTCESHVCKKCPDYMKVLEPRTLISMKTLHLFLKFPELYNGIAGFLHLFLRCSTKTHAEGVAESMGNYVDFYSDKKRGLDIKAVGDEALIHWNGPPVHLADGLGKAALDRRFGGRRGWRFITKKGKAESLVVSRLKKRVSRTPFFQ